MMDTMRSEYRDTTYYVAHRLGDERADVNIYSSDGDEFAFELAVIRPEDPKRLERLRATVHAWIDGLHNARWPSNDL
jgi:hypothetical protein